MTDNKISSEQQIAELDKKLTEIDEAIAKHTAILNATRTQNVNDQTRQQSLLRSAKLLESKLLALDRNRAIFTNRLTEVNKRLDDGTDILQETSKRQTEVVAQLDAIQERQRNLSVTMEASKEEVKRLQGTINGCKAEREDLLTRRKEIIKLKEKANVNLLREQKASQGQIQQLEESKRHVAMLAKELDAAKEANEKKGMALEDTSPLKKQQDVLNQKMVELTSAIEQRAHNIATLLNQIKDYAVEVENIEELLPSLEANLKEHDAAVVSCVKAEEESAKELKRLSMEANSWKARLVKVQETRADLDSKIGRMVSIQKQLMEQLDKMAEAKEKFAARLNDVRNGETALGARMRQDAAAMNALREQIDALRGDRYQIAKQRNSLKPQEQREMSAPRIPPVTVELQFVTATGETVSGTMTTTSFLVIFESVPPDGLKKADYDDKWKFCVDMQDVAMCRLYDAVTQEDMSNVPDPATDQHVQHILFPPSPSNNGTSVPASASPASQASTAPLQRTDSLPVVDGFSVVPMPKERRLMLEIVFQPNYRNRFLFHDQSLEEEKEEANPSPTHVRLTGAAANLRASYRALREAILQHEDFHRQSESQLLLASPRGKDSPRQRRGSEGGSSTGHPTQLSPASKPLPAPATKVIGSSDIVSKDQFDALLRALPPRFQLDDYHLVYTITKDGTSLKTFHQKVEGAPVSLLLFRDGEGQVFGGFASQPWQQKSMYYGAGESFVFRFHPDFEIYRWSGRNNYFMLSDDKSIAMGGGGNFAFYLDDRFEHGSSGPCSTFDCPMLAASRDFTCMRMEVWAPISGL